MNISDLVNSTPVLPKVIDTSFPSPESATVDLVSSPKSFGSPNVYSRSVSSPMSLTAITLTNEDSPYRSPLSSPNNSPLNTPTHNSSFSLLTSPKRAYSLPLVMGKTLPPHPIPSRSTSAQIPTQSPSGTQHSQPVKKFPCMEPGCTKSFTRRYNLSAHLRCHRSEKPFSCQQCPLKFARKHDLTRHVRSLHELKRAFGPCGYCGSFFTRSDALARHLKVEAERRGFVAGEQHGIAQRGIESITGAGAGTGHHDHDFENHEL